jgi:hypothetical protein
MAERCRVRFTGAETEEIEATSKEERRIVK